MGSRLPIATGDFAWSREWKQDVTAESPGVGRVRQLGRAHATCVAWEIWAAPLHRRWTCRVVGFLMVCLGNSRHMASPKEEIADFIWCGLVDLISCGLAD